ncbi:4'-phosphopantetheinyl transferase family protein [Streptomyces sporangiiformans]|uniref:4'-phosphopantetheinyl transferase superfamily protein n=1 Tax=Streptomyces sporangiiformans TaxID=2315329 RepID=A0A505D0P4_9ACTN|nr:4'-phosphopantetheinyl transferase superfamily protein [Streptomyces sporangiiformans]TPQ17324.1 4'-phosphopantetheinyl transferase superfamily protein [Streptomyces sporangiiformans]
MIEELLPKSVAVAEAFGDPAVPPALFAEEAACVANSVPSRQAEFRTVRACAREALGQLGMGPVPILPGTRGAPRWPTSVVGSMTHCAGYRAAAVGFAEDLVTVGVDAEPNRPLPDADVLEAVTIAEERTMLAGLAARQPDVRWDRLLFSAKESVYKAWYPLTGRPLNFDEALITVDPTSGRFFARLLVPGPVWAGTRLTGFNGAWLAREGLVVTAIAVTSDAVRETT